MKTKPMVYGAALALLAALSTSRATDLDNRDIRFIAQGANVAYSTARNQIAFSRFDPAVIGGPQRNGDNDNTGTFQLWIADADGGNQRCISCRQTSGGPRPNQHVSIPSWSPSGEWLIVSVEMPVHSAPHAKTHGGMGAYVDIWAVAPDRDEWHRLTHYADHIYRTWFPDRPVGALIPRLSRRGDRLVWAEMIGYDVAHPFGVWQLALATLVFRDGVPMLVGKQISRPGQFDMTFYEAWSFSADDQWITVASDSGPAAAGYIDVQLWNPATDALINLTHSVLQYEEQSVFSPDGKRIVYMSSAGQTPPFEPYRDFWNTFRTDLWIMNANGSDPRRLTWFSEPGEPEYLPGAVNRAIPGSWTAEGRYLYFDVARNIGDHQVHEDSRIYRITVSQ